MSIRFFTDGGSRGNPGLSAAGVFFPDLDGGLRRGVYIGNDKTNNEAEYYALLLGLEIAAERQVPRIEIFSDSMLMVNHMIGKWQVKAPTILPLYYKAFAMRQRFEGLNISYVPREKNTEADAVVNSVMDRVAAGEEIPKFKQLIL
jgi:ribonuclease HI